MMVGAWLYTQDGRQVAYVSVALPMPMGVCYGGFAYYWQGGRYVQIGPYPAAPVSPADPGTPEAKPEHHPRT